MYNIEQIKEDLKNSLSEKRYKHILNVASTAESLARINHLNEEEAYLAGLLHDIAREFTQEKNAEWIKKSHLPAYLLQDEYKNIIHADIGAEVARTLYQINDDIYYAIKYHTIGNINMNMLAKVIFISDKIGRENLTPELEQIKKLAYQDIDNSLKGYLELSFRNLADRGLKPHPDTIELLKKLDT